MGKGIAIGNKYSLAPSVSAALVKVHHDQTIEVRTITVEIGQGSFTTFAQVASEEFKMPLDKINTRWLRYCDNAVRPWSYFEQINLQCRKCRTSGLSRREASII